MLSTEEAVAKSFTLVEGINGFSLVLKEDPKVKKKGKERSEKLARRRRLHYCKITRGDEGEKLGEEWRGREEGDDNDNA